MREEQSDLYPGFKGRVRPSQDPGYGGGSVESPPVVELGWLGTWVPHFSHHTFPLFSCYFRVWECQIILSYQGIGIYGLGNGRVWAGPKVA